MKAFPLNGETVYFKFPQHKAENQLLSAAKVYNGIDIDSVSTTSQVSFLFLSLSPFTFRFSLHRSPRESEEGGEAEEMISSTRGVNQAA